MKKDNERIAAKFGLITGLFAVIGAFWRRWFGGGFGKLGDITRLFKYIALAGVVAAMYYAAGKFDVKDGRMYAVLIAFAIHWAVGRGDYFYVYDTGADEGRIKWIDWVLRKIYGVGGYYNFKGNVTGLFLRYTATAALVAVFIPDAFFLLAGALTAAVYAVTGKMKYAIPCAEFLSGAVNFALLYLCIGG